MIRSIILSCFEFQPKSSAAKFPLARFEPSHGTRKLSVAKPGITPEMAIVYWKIVDAKLQRAPRAKWMRQKKLLAVAIRRLRRDLRVFARDIIAGGGA